MATFYWKHKEEDKNPIHITTGPLDPFTVEEKGSGFVCHPSIYFPSHLLHVIIPHPWTDTPQKIRCTLKSQSMDDIAEKKDMTLISPCTCLSNNLSRKGHSPSKQLLPFSNSVGLEIEPA